MTSIHCGVPWEKMGNSFFRISGLRGKRSIAASRGKTQANKGREGERLGKPVFIC